jgi:hypothetical protein
VRRQADIERVIVHGLPGRVGGSSCMEGPTSSRESLSDRAPVAINASSTRARIGLRAGNDSALSTTGRSWSGDGRFRSDGGTMISTASL